MDACGPSGQFLSALVGLRGPLLSTLHTSPCYSAFRFQDHPAFVTFLELTVALTSMETGLASLTLLSPTPTTGLTGWLVSGNQNRDSVPWLPAQHLSQPGTHRHRMYLSNDYVICCWPLRWTGLFSHHLMGSPMQIPESWLAWPRS